MADPVGLREAARQLGISHVALLKAATTGRVPRQQDKRFDVDACRIALSQNTHPLKSGYARLQQEVAPPVALPSGDGLAADQETVPSGDEGQRSFELGPASESVAEATRQLEWQRVREKKLKLDREEGKLVELAPVNAFVAGMILQTRDELIRMATEMRDELAHELDPLKCEAIVLGRVNSILGKMSEYRRES